jgi:hypothetical protein
MSCRDSCSSNSIGIACTYFYEKNHGSNPSSPTIDLLKKINNNKHVLLSLHIMLEFARIVACLMVPFLLRCLFEEVYIYIYIYIYI